ncbi:hypothetical protein [Oceanirhabdus sp. W0125-5]|uniref:hypothetical protein n=1 Tax=Oceanirhabdus sp. W0125-5 TaxID=2999116 RepID=UPI0022F314D5|nr:hypothetical protein [Oceanirhabdus sp. W0125-5]WBW98115.1 hypothetical protein OW730_04945 [Oceanirhabdus sp. W0125-5]
MKKFLKYILLPIIFISMIALWYFQYTKCKAYEKYISSLISYKIESVINSTSINKDIISGVVKNQKISLEEYNVLVKNYREVSIEMQNIYLLADKMNIKNVSNEPSIMFQKVYYYIKDLEINERFDEKTSNNIKSIYNITSECCEVINYLDNYSKEKSHIEYWQISNKRWIDFLEFFTETSKMNKMYWLDL